SARQQYRELERLLAQELGAEPSAELRALVDDLERFGRQATSPVNHPVALASAELPAPHPSVLPLPVASAPLSSPLTGTITFLLAESERPEGGPGTSVGAWG